MRHFKTTPTSAFIFYRSYSRWSGKARETWNETIDRCVDGLAELGELTPEEIILLYSQFDESIALPSGRYMWCGGTEWSDKQANYPGMYNCSSTVVDSIETFGYLMDLAMTGCFAPGTLVLTKEGHFPIENLVGKSVEIWDGLNWVDCDNFRVTGYDRSTYKVEFCDGSSEVATADHHWTTSDGSRKTTLNLLSNDVIQRHSVRLQGDLNEPAAYLKGFLIGDGNIFGREESRKAQLQLAFPKYICESKLIESANQLVDDKNSDIRCKQWGFTEEYQSSSVKGRKTMQGLAQFNLTDWVSVYKSKLPSYAFNWNDISKSEFLSGLFDADGCCRDNPRSGFAYVLSSVHQEFLVDIQKLLKTISINSVIRKTRNAGSAFMSHRQKWINQKDLYRLSITSTDAVGLAIFCKFTRLKSLSEVIPGLKKDKSSQIKSVTVSGMADEVYCCTIPTTHNFALSSGIMTGNCGTGAVLELENIVKLPPIKTKLNIELVGNIGTKLKSDRQSDTLSEEVLGEVWIAVGDSRRGWVDSYMELIRRATTDGLGESIDVKVDLSNVRPAGERLSGFGGTANPSKLPELYGKVAAILNGAIGRQLNSIECCKLIDEAALVIVAGNIRRSAGIRQFSADDPLALIAKDSLWQQGEDGKWGIDPERDALRMANHTRVFHSKPTLTECIDSVRKQYYSGEGAIQWAGEAVARANADLLDTADKKAVFLAKYEQDRALAKGWLDKLGMCAEDESVLNHRMSGYHLNPCALGSMELLTVDGYQTFESLDGQYIDIINASGQVSKSKVWCSGTKETIEITFCGGFKPLICTPDHQLMDVDGNTILAGESKGRRLMPFTARPIHDPMYVVYGIVQCDGVLSDLANPEKRGVNLCVGDRDADFINILNDAGLAYTVSKNLKNVYISNGFSDRLKSLGFSDKKLPERELPTSFRDWTVKQKKAFLNGVFTANGCVHLSESTKGRISLKATCKAFIDSIQSLLAEFNIQSYITVNKPKVNKFSNGEYTMKQSYDLNIQQYFSRSEFSRLIGFSLEYKSDLLAQKLIETAPKVRLIRPYGKHKVYDFTEPLTHWGIVNTTVFHNCGEILIRGDNFCNLAEIHLNTIDPFDLDAQVSAFKAASLSVAALLHHEFEIPRYQKSRELDPIVGVSFTGLFDFFVHLFGVEWLEWWSLGRPAKWCSPMDINKGSRYYPLIECDFIRVYHFDSMSDLFLAIEEEYLCSWRSMVADTVTEYCERHGLKVPSRYTTCQPAGSKSLLTGASPGWHPPKASRYIRRMTFGKGEPIALAAIDMGYSVIPSQSDKDENGNLLNDIHDPRVTEWLVEIPCATSWADMPGVDSIDISQFSALAQFDFYMQVQRYYSTHTTSATIELREHEIEPLATAIYEDIQSDGGYMSAALLARFDSLETFPRLPFEPIDKDRYTQELANIAMRRVESDFDVALAKHDRGQTAESGPSGCDSDRCLIGGDRKAN